MLSFPTPKPVTSGGSRISLTRECQPQSGVRLPTYYFDPFFQARDESKTVYENMQWENCLNVHLSSSGSSGQVRGDEKHKIYVAAPGSHLFYNLLLAH